MNFRRFIKTINLIFNKMTSSSTFLIYGANGFIGNLFIDYITKHHPGIKIVRGKSRVDDQINLLIELKTICPTHVLSLIGRTHGTVETEIGQQKINTIDYLEYPGKLVENVRDNLYGPMILAALCQRNGIHFTYLGTGCIFNSKYTDIGPVNSFGESSKPNYFGSSYSVVKGFTDQLMQTCYPDMLNLRIRMPISSVPNSRNFIDKIIKYEKICSVKNSMTILDDFFPIFVDMMLNKKAGTYNCTNPGTISHNEILSVYRNIIDPQFTWKNFTLEEQQKILKSDRSNNLLDTSKITSEYPDLLPIEKSILMLMVEMKTHLNK